MTDDKGRTTGGDAPGTSMLLEPEPIMPTRVSRGSMPPAPSADPNVPLVESDRSPTWTRDIGINPEDTGNLNRTLTESMRRKLWDELSLLQGSPAPAPRDTHPPIDLTDEPPEMTPQDTPRDNIMHELDAHDVRDDSSRDVLDDAEILSEEPLTQHRPTGPPDALLAASMPSSRHDPPPLSTMETPRAPAHDAQDQLSRVDTRPPAPPGTKRPQIRQTGAPTTAPIPPPPRPVPDIMTGTLASAGTDVLLPPPKRESARPPRVPVAADVNGHEASPPSSPLSDEVDETHVVIGDIPSIEEDETPEDAALAEPSRRRALEERVARLSDDARIDALCDLGDYLEGKTKDRAAAIATFEDALAQKPGHKRALMALERNYKAEGDFVKVAYLYELAAHSTTDSRQRVEAILRAAATLADKASRPEEAFALLARMRDLSDDPRVTEAFAELAAKLQREDAYIDAKIALSKNAKAKRKAAAHLRDAAKMLLSCAEGTAPGAPRDPRVMRAKDLLEQATREDKSFYSAWADLAEVARRVGDQDELRRVLEESARYASTEERAPSYRELGFAKAAAGDDRGALVALEVSLQADASQLDVAARVLAGYVTQGRFPDAARLATRVEALLQTSPQAQDEWLAYDASLAVARALIAVNDVGRGVEHLARAAGVMPQRTEAWSELAPLAKSFDLTVLRSRLAPALEQARAAAMSLDVAQLVELARFEMALGDPLGASQSLSVALQKDPTSRTALMALGEACFRRGDWSGAADSEVSLARSAETSSDRFVHLARAGDIWARHGQDLTEAERCYVDALRVQPSDVNVLESLASVYSRLERWSDLARILEAITLHAPDNERKIAATVALASVSEEKLGDGVAAIAHAEAVLDLAPKRLDAFERVVRLYTMRKDWPGLAASYREMIRRAEAGRAPVPTTPAGSAALGATLPPPSADPNAVLLHALWSQLGLVYRDRLRESESALEAFAQALVASPAEVATRQMAIELTMLLGRHDEAIDQANALVATSPSDPVAFRSLYDVSLRKGDFDRAWCAVNVLSELVTLDAEQAQFVADYPPLMIESIPGQITTDAWPSHVLSEELDPLTTTLLATIAPAYARFKDQRLGSGTPDLLERAHAEAHRRIAPLLTHASEILGVETPPLFVSPFGSRGPGLFASVHFRGLFVDPAAVPHDGTTWTYMLVRKLTELRPQLWARTVSSDLQELRGMLALAVRVGNRTAGTGGFATSDQPILAWMSPDEASRIESAVRDALAANAMLDLRRWWRAAEVSMLRAGLLIVGDVRLVKRALLQDALSSSDLPVQERIFELYRVAVSERYLQLRAAIGVSVGSSS